MKWKFWEKFKRQEKSRTKILDRSRAYLVVSSEDFDKTEYGEVREALEKAKLVTVLPRVGVGFGVEAEYPKDFGDYKDYYDAYQYVPFVGQAVQIKQMLIWQNGFDTESKFKLHKNEADDFLKQIQADVTLQEGTLHGLITGNAYWLGEKVDDAWRFTSLSSRKVLYAKGWKGFKWIHEDKQPETVPELTAAKRRGVLHLAFNRVDSPHYGVGCLTRVLPTVKALLYMQVTMPKIVRKRGDPLLSIKIDARSEEEFNRIKKQIMARKGSEDIFHDGTVELEEVYKATPRFGVAEIVEHFTDNLVAGLGVPEVALGFGGTTTMATALYQEKLLIGELRSYQRVIKRFIEHQLFPLANIRDVKVNWRPIKAEDVFQLSKRWMSEIEHGVISPAYASQLLGYPAEARKGALVNQQLVPVLEPEEKSETKSAETDSAEQN